MKVQIFFTSILFFAVGCDNTQPQQGLLDTKNAKIPLVSNYKAPKKPHQPITFTIAEGGMISFLVTQSNPDNASVTSFTLVRNFKGIADTTKMLIRGNQTNYFTERRPGDFQLMTTSNDGSSSDGSTPPDGGGTGTEPDSGGDGTNGGGGNTGGGDNGGGGTSGGSQPPGVISQPNTDSLTSVNPYVYPTTTTYSNPCPPNTSQPCNQSSVIVQPIGDSLQSVSLKTAFRYIEVMKK